MTAARRPTTQGGPDPGGDAGTPRVVDAIRADVVAGTFRPGDRLTEEALALRYGVSRIPVREALRTLASEGFVRSRRYGGTYVEELTDAEAEDLLAIRLLIEPFGAERAAVRRTEAQLAELEHLIAQAGTVLEGGGGPARLAQLNTRFHRTIAEASGSPTLAALVAQLGAKISWVYSHGAHERAARSWAEHAQIVAALRARDATRSRDRLAEHVREAQAAYRRSSG
ncbi:GntR family transcriptional regulator [Luteimicrobium sp. DT211]|uniref:GntR family transcriptional regulator n=1 Tax=Luteimicrobium sp. DT211 TaxID=3393412 RepID=UPI003CF6A7B0